MYCVNEQLSTQIAAKYSSLFMVKGCYENVYHLAMDDVEELEPSLALRILICYSCNAEGMYYRHAFYVHQSTIVEPLPNIRDGLDPETIITIADLSFDDYLALLQKDERYDLFPSLLHREIEVFNTNPVLSTNLNPIDLGEILRALSNTQDEYMKRLRDVQKGEGIVP